ncbi:[Protein-PII] uridylyltransferase / [Protein-PII]-UMP uridylyl-removing enzyme [hydrothermal vent metagenome]|uniref:[Protein-PII] uridylyltransferase / [Protein-PII]-UMP uridylyl-removing enzyme n=1 Tax=hydrothermal vent metagenome TaxID=652676 RepID=A0A3B0S8H8_9ZZZZ
MNARADIPGRAASPGNRTVRQREIIDRRALNEQIVALIDTDGIAQSRARILTLLQKALSDGREEISQRLLAKPSAGHAAASDQSFLIDQLVRIIHDIAVKYQYPVGNPSSGERITVMAVGGYGRDEMAPHSDVDIAFITPFKRTSWTEQAVEAMLYWLWDLSLKVGQSSRSIDEMVHMANEDLSIRTALLEGRYVWGDTGVYEEAKARFFSDVVEGNDRTFVSEKLAERDERHKRMGDSRYVVEPNVKEGKGGLRDLQTLYWIGKFIHRVASARELIDVGLLTRNEFLRFRKAANFLWAVRCHMHDMTGRAEDRLTFDLQTEVAQRMRFADRTGKSSVERFMQYYFLNAKVVGNLTGVFLAHLDETHAAGVRRFIPNITRRPKKLNGFILDRGRLALPEESFFAEDPIRLIEIFQLADKHELEIHPLAMRAARRDAKLITNEIRKDKRTNRLFLDVLCSPRDPELVLRWMNEASIFGRFIPDFGRVVAQMQFDMYHHYTVDEHSIRAIGLLAKIGRGELVEDHPNSTKTMQKLKNRRVLFVATLLHDIAKGRGGDHSVLGAEVAMKLCPRLGLEPYETELVAWLVRHHLLMSAMAFKRDLSDYKTIQDFVSQVKSVERLRLLTVLTSVDIRAVGPGVWNSWKRQLLTDLFEAAEEMLRLGHKQRGRKERITEKQATLAAALNLPKARFNKLAKRLPEPYWIAEPEDVIEHNARLMLAAGDDNLAISAEVYPERGATLITIYAADHPGLFFRIAGGIHVAGGNIIDARIHTTRDGMALDNFLVQDPFGRPFSEASQLERLKKAVEDALANRSKLALKLEARPLALTRADAFNITPVTMVDNDASNRFTVIEVNAQDRPALLNALAYALFQSKVTVHSAHISTYGERAVDTFYVTDLLGAKIESKARLSNLKTKLTKAASQEVSAIETA